MCWTDPTARDDKIVLLAHPPCRFAYLILIIRNDLYSLQLYPKRKAVLGKKTGIGISSFATQHLIANDNATSGVYHAFAPILCW